MYIQCYAIRIVLVICKSWGPLRPRLRPEAFAMHSSSAPVPWLPIVVGVVHEVMRAKIPGEDGVGPHLYRIIPRAGLMARTVMWAVIHK